MTAIRQATLQPAHLWERPAGSEVRAMLDLIGITDAEASDMLGLTPQDTKKSGYGSRTVRRWTAGDAKIPYAAWAILAHRAGFGTIWVSEASR